MFAEFVEKFSWIRDLPQIVTAVAAVVALLGVRAQIRSTLEWNKRRTSYDVLNDIVNGDFASLLERLHREFGWDIVRDPRTYAEVKSEIDADGDAERALELMLVTQRLLRQLEVLFINVERKIVREDICKQYLVSIVGNIYRKTLPFVESDRKQRSDKRVFQVFEKYGRRWSLEDRLIPGRR